MGEDINTWRLRIGLHKQPRSFRVVSLDTYTPMSTWSTTNDMMFRLTATCIVLLALGVAGYLSVEVCDQLSNLKVWYTAEKYILKANVFHDDVTVNKSASLYRGTLYTNTNVQFDNYGVKHMLLIQSGDVEMNPGPFDSGIEAILDQMKKDKEYVCNQVSELKSAVLKVQDTYKDLDNKCDEIKKDITETLGAIRNDISAIKKTQTQMKSDIAKVSERTSKMEKEFHLIHNTAEQADVTHKQLVQLQDEVDRLEARSRWDNLLIYGVRESCDEDADVCKQKVVDTLNIVRSDDPLVLEDITRAHRLGKPVFGKARPMIAKFVDGARKIAVLKDRSKLSDHNIGVANDLTKRQRQKLSQLRSENKRGYYKGGRLVVEDLPPTDSAELSGYATGESGDQSTMESRDPGRVLRSRSQVNSTCRK